MTVSGHIVEYTGESIVIHTRIGQREHTFPSADVVRVTTPQTEGHVNGLSSFAQGRYDEAARSFEEALETESRSWVRRELLAMLVRCALQSGDYATAGSRFALLSRSEANTRHFELIPLVWASGSVDAALRHEAAIWMTASHPETERLLGASVLLDLAERADDAADQLGRLSKSADPRIRMLAAAQLWRYRLRTGEVGESQLEQWHKHIESMPEALRGGPYYVLGRGYRAKGDNAAAAAAFLWVPLAYPHDHYLAGRAALDAADALAMLGQKQEALAMYTEVMERFAETPFAEQASAVLKPSSETSRED